MKKADRDRIAEYSLSPIIELSGNTYCTIEGIKRISEFTNEKIKIDIGKLSVSLTGDGLSIRDFSPQGAEIEGTIIALEFESNG